MHPWININKSEDFFDGTNLKSFGVTFEWSGRRKKNLYLQCMRLVHPTLIILWYLTTRIYKFQFGFPHFASLFMQTSSVAHSFMPIMDAYCDLLQFNRAPDIPPDIKYMIVLSKSWHGFIQFQLIFEIPFLIFPVHVVSLLFTLPQFVRSVGRCWWL